MEKTKAPRKTDCDIFLAKKLNGANFNTGFYQLPEIKKIEIEKPDGLVLWSKRNSCKNKSKYGLIFYEFDSKFDGKNGIYNILKYGNEKKVQYLIDEIKEFSFVVCPDYSVYGNFPNYKQIDALSKSREVGYVLSTFGVKVIINYRATFEWTYELALSGIQKNSIVSIGTLGTLKEKETRRLLKKSVDVLIKNVQPKILIVYGKAPSEIFKIASDYKIDIWQYDSEIARAFKEAK